MVSEGNSNAVSGSTQVDISAREMGDRTRDPDGVRVPSLPPTWVAAITHSCAGESWVSAHCPV